MRSLVPVLLAICLAALPVRADDDANVIIEFGVVQASSLSPEAGQSPAPHRQLHIDLSRIAKRFSVRHEYRHAFNGVSARVSRETLEKIARLPYVKAVHKDRTVHALVEYSVPLVGAPEVWQRLGARGKGVTVAVIDSGIDYRHHSLGGGIGPGKKVVGGWDFADDDADPMDEFGHGTHVAGIIAGDDAPIIGVAPEASLIAFKVLGKDGTGLDSAIIAAIDRSLDPNGDGDTSDRVDVVNLSLGRTTWGGDDPMVQAVERAVAAGIIVVVAAGNKGEALTIHTPAIAPSVITVGSTDKDKVSSFSSRGPVPATWALKPEVAAPGQGITSAKAGGEKWTTNGTSAAAPHVAGVAALIREVHPTWTPSEVKAAIVSTATPIRLNSALRTLATGGGRVDAAKAVDATILPSPATIAFGIGGSSRTIRLTNRGSAAQTLTITATDVPFGATITANPSTVTIEPDAFADVTITLTVTAPLSPTDEGLAASGHIEIASATTSAHVPWAAMAGHQVAVAYRGREPHELHVVTPARDAVSFIQEPWTMSAVVQPGTADIVVLTYPESGKPRMIVREKVPVSGFTYLTIDPDEASLELDVAGVDTAGAPLRSLASRMVAHELALPSGRVIEWWPTSTPILVGPMQTTALRTYEMAAGYFGMHRVLAGMQQNETLTFPTTDWTRQPVELRCTSDCEFAGAIGFGSRLGYRVPVGTGTTYRDAFHVTPSREEGFSFRAYAMTRRLGQGDSAQRKSWMMLSPAMRTDGARVTFLATDVPWPVDYTPPRIGSTVSFGDGPGLMRTSMGPRAADEWAVTATPIGALGEDLADSQLRLTFSLHNSQEKAVKWQQVFVAGHFVTTDALPPDTYRLRIVNENHRVNGAKAKGTLTSTFDTRVHPAAPTLTSLRVEDSSRSAVTTIRSGENARILFSARQTTSSLGVVTHAPVVDSATKAWWRASGTTEWQPLSIAIVASQYENTGGSGPAGTVFAADLQSMSRLVVGSVDLRIEVTNEHGATTEWVLEPAFAIVKSAGGKRRSVR